MQVVCVDVPFSVTSVSYLSRLTDWCCHFYFIHRCPEYFTSALVSRENQVSEHICWKMEQQESEWVALCLSCSACVHMNMCLQAHTCCSITIPELQNLPFSWWKAPMLCPLSSPVELLVRAEILFHRKPGTLASCMEIPWRTSWRSEGEGDFYQEKPDVVCAECLWWCLERQMDREDKDLGGNSHFLNLGWLSWVDWNDEDVGIPTRGASAQLHKAGASRW